MHYWVPVWSTDRPLVQRVLQHPSPLLVVANSYARFYGVVKGMSTVVLEGQGWAFGVMLRPAAGLLLGRPMTEITDGYVDLTELASIDGHALTELVRTVMQRAPHHPRNHDQARAAVEHALRPFLPLDLDGHRVNAAVDAVHADPAPARVADLADHVGLTERSLQRLLERRLGLTPKWLLQRRRIHDAVLLLKSGTVPLADVAAATGYADQAHFSNDFRAVTGMTAGEYRADQR